MASMDVSDAFDEISNWEEQLLIEGEELGMERGRELGVEEGRELGCVALCHTCACICACVCMYDSKPHCYSLVHITFTIDCMRLTDCCSLA